MMSFAGWLHDRDASLRAASLDALLVLLQAVGPQRFLSVAGACASADKLSSVSACPCALLAVAR